MNLSELRKAIEKLQADYQVSDEAILMGTHREFLPLLFLDKDRLFVIKEDKVYEVKT